MCHATDNKTAAQMFFNPMTMKYILVTDSKFTILRITGALIDKGICFNYQASSTSLIIEVTNETAAAFWNIIEESSNHTVREYRDETPTDLDLDKELEKIRCRLFDLANSVAGNDKGNAAVYLHGAANRINEAIKCLERGNPSTDPIPAWAMRSMIGSSIDS